MGIKDKCVLITGGANGIGFICVQELLRHGAKRVIIVDQNKAAGDRALENLKEFGKDRTTFFCCDITNGEQFTDVFKKAHELCNGLDIVINNAGILDDTKWELMIDINFKALVRGTLLAVEYMGKKNGGKGGTILNTASIAGLDTFSVIPVYSGTKFAVVGFTKGMQGLYDLTGVRVLALCPGVTQTTLVANMDKKLLDCSSVEKIRGNLPQQGPETVAKAMMTMLEKGENGDVWVIEGNEPPYAVETPHYSNLRVTK